MIRESIEPRPGKARGETPGVVYSQKMDDWKAKASATSSDGVEKDHRKRKRRRRCSASYSDSRGSSDNDEGNSFCLCSRSLSGRQRRHLSSPCRTQASFCNMD